MTVNKIILVGYLGRAPEKRYTPDGTPVTTISLATSEFWKNSKNEKQSKTEWHTLKLFRNLADIAEKYLQTGSLIYVEGRVSSRKYTDKNHNERIAYEIIVNELKMLGNKDNKETISSNTDTDESLPLSESEDVDEIPL